jgi:hypothetical protein
MMNIVDHVYKMATVLLPSELDSVRDRSYIFFSVMIVLGLVTAYTSWSNIVALSEVAPGSSAGATCTPSQVSTLTIYNLINLVMGVAVVTGSLTFLLTSVRLSFDGYSLNRYALMVLIFAAIQIVLAIMSLGVLDVGSCNSALTGVNQNTVITLVVAIIVALGSGAIMYLSGFKF